MNSRFCHDAELQPCGLQGVTDAVIADGEVDGVGGVLHVSRGENGQAATLLVSGLVIQESGDGFAHAAKGMEHDLAVSASAVNVTVGHG